MDRFYSRGQGETKADFYVISKSFRFNYLVLGGLEFMRNKDCTGQVWARPIDCEKTGVYVVVIVFPGAQEAAPLA